MKKILILVTIVTFIAVPVQAWQFPWNRAKIAAAQAADPDWTVAQIVDFIRRDVQNALDGAIAGHDELGQRCHQDALNLLNSVAGTQQMKVSGTASLAEQLRLARLSLIANGPQWQQVKDECLPIYNISGVFSVLLRRLGLDVLL